MTKDRRQELTRTAVVALAVSLCVCMGVHNGHGLGEKLAFLIPASCTATPVYTLHVEAGVADSADDLPAKHRAAPAK